MNFEKMLEIVAGEPVFETGLLLAGDLDPAGVRRQLSRWVRSGRIYQLRRGLYALAPPFQKVSPHPFLIANRLVRGSYVSCQSALAHFHLIPEYVSEVTSICSKRPGRWTTPLGRFSYRHVKQDLFWGYRLCDLGKGQQAFIAEPEKALLDLVHLQPGGDDLEYLKGLRLNLDGFDLDGIAGMARGRPKLQRAVQQLREMAEEETAFYEAL